MIGRDWWLYTPLHINVPSIICPDVFMEDKKMRFTSKFDHHCVGLGDMHTIVDKCDKKNIVNDICLTQAEAKDFVKWLNENIKEKEKSFDEIVMEVIDVLWDGDDINISKNGDEYVIHELKTTCILPSHIKEMLPDDGFVVHDELIICGRSIFVIRRE